MALGYIRPTRIGTLVPTKSFSTRGWAETKQFLFILKIYNNDKYPKQNQIGAKYVFTLYSIAKYQIKVF